MLHLRWAMPEALLISVRMNIPCWIMANHSWSPRRESRTNDPSTTGCAEYGGSNKPLVFDAELDTVRMPW